MVCLCDIPLSRIQEHVGFYGEFGLGMTKEWAELNGLTPVLYVAPGTNIARSFREMNEHVHKLREESDKQAAKVTLRRLLAFSKPTDGNMVVDGKPVVKAFYQESEWRYIPVHEEITEYLKRMDFEDETTLQEANAGTQAHCSLPITPRDIKYIFVRADADIPDIINFIQTDLDQFPSAELKVLMSRVTSLESIGKDL